MPVLDKYVHLKLWEDDHETVVRKLVHDHGFKGETAIKALLGTWIWEAHTKRFRQSFLKRLRDLGVQVRVTKVKGKTHILMIGIDRIRVAKGIIRASLSHTITPLQKEDFLLRLARSEFPNPDDDFEVGFEMDLLLSE